MQLPKEGTQYSNVTRFTRYVGRRLRRAGKEALAKDMLSACFAGSRMGRLR